MDPQKLLVRAASYRLMSILAETEPAARELRELAEEFEALANGFRQGENDASEPYQLVIRHPTADLFVFF